MREEISEPKHWRSSTRRRRIEATSNSLAYLPREAVDAAFAEESISAEPESDLQKDLLQNISTQLGMLKAQQEHLQQLLAQAQES